MTAAGTGLVSDTLSAVERELTALWARTAGEPARARASTANVVLLADAAQQTAMADLADRLAVAELARTFVVSVDPRIAPWAVEHSVAARCRADQGESLCAERIDLAFGSSAIARAPSVMASLFVGEVPTIIVGVARVSASLLDTLASLADRAIIDSAVIGLSEAHRFAKSSVSRPLFDLSFARLAPLRRLLALAFDDAGARQSLTSIRSLRITMRSGETSASTEARLLVGWLAAALGWKALGGQLFSAPTGEPLDLHVDASDLAHPACSVSSVALHAGLDGNELRVTIEPSPDGASLVMRRVGGAVPDLRSSVHAPARTTEALIDEGVESTDTGQTWRRALERAVSLEGHLQHG